VGETAVGYGRIRFCFWLLLKKGGGITGVLPLFLFGRLNILISLQSI
jgi:hypothetical protein